MELDNIKALWQKNNNTPSFLSEAEIKNMLTNKGEGALNKLIKWEKTCLWLIPVLTLFFWGILYMQSNLAGSFSNGLLWLGVIFSIYALYSFISGCYKYNFLNKIDMVTMDMITVSNLMITYKKFVIYEFIASFCLVVPFLVAIIVIFLGTEQKVWMYLAFALYSIVLLIIAYFILKKFYFKRIKTIQQSIKEIREFEEE